MCNMYICKKETMLKYEKKFLDWLKELGLEENGKTTIFNSCLRISEKYDIENEFEKDEAKELMNLFRYSVHDARKKMNQNIKFQ